MLCALTYIVAETVFLCFLPVVWYLYFRTVNHGFDVRNSFLDKALINYGILLTCNNFLLMDPMFENSIFVGVAYVIFTLTTLVWMLFMKFERWLVAWTRKQEKG